MSYSTLLLDFDHTLFDSDACEAEAFERTLGEFGISGSPAHFEIYSRINQALWLAVEAGSIGPDEVRTRRFERFAAEAGLEADPVAMANSYVEAMGAHGDLYPGVRPVLERLADSASLALITNGLSAVQRSRIERLAIGPCFDAIVISEEVGSSKPARAIFDAAFEQLGRPERETVLMIGDSLSSDIRGGSDYGVATCWYNPDGKLPGPDDRITHEIVTLVQLLSLAADGE